MSATVSSSSKFNVSLSFKTTLSSEADVKADIEKAVQELIEKLAGKGLQVSNRRVVEDVYIPSGTIELPRASFDGMFDPD